MSITRNRSYTIHTEVKICRREASLLQEGHDETTETAIDVQANLVLLGQFTQGSDIISDTVREVDGGTSNLDCIVSILEPIDQ